MNFFKGLNMTKGRLISLAAGLLLISASAALAAGGEGHHADSGVLLKDFLYRCLNFAVMAGIIGYFITKPIRKGMAARREGIEKDLREARAAKEEAETRFAEYDRKLSKASAEIEEIYATIRKEGELEREKILANAREMAEKIRLEAEKTAANEVNKARAQLRQEATRMAVEIAEELLKKNFTGEDHSRLVDEYLQKVGELH